MTTRRLLVFAAVAEAVTGLALLIVPSLVVRLLFDGDLVGIGVLTGRFAGLALFTVGVACWPSGSASRALTGMLTYTLLATLGLLYVGFGGESTGPFLWPAVLLHAVLTVLLARAWFKPRQGQ